MKNRIRLSDSPYRMLATDILPYERPPFFSNRFFARIMKYYSVRTEDDRLVAGRHADDEGIADLLTLLSGSSASPRRSFKYKISKDGVEGGRILPVIHPFHQLEMMEFYKKFESLIIYYCGRSDFSLRHPVKVAREVKGKVEFARVISDDAEVNLTQEHARNYFVYHLIPNIALFYDKYLDLRLEKQFNYKAKIDIKECFDSIDPQILPRLIMGEHQGEDDFASVFAELQLKFSGSEKGIVIGPEFSRIFAEMFLQQIEKRMERRFTEINLLYPKDFRLLRYVDDSFIYANTVDRINDVIRIYSEELQKVGLYLKKEKAKLYTSKPFIDEISVVKDRLKGIIETAFENRLRNFKGFLNVQEGIYDQPAVINFKNFIVSMRNQVASARVSEGFSAEVNKGNAEEWTDWTAENKVSIYKDISSFLLSVIRKRLRNLLKEFNDLYRVYSQEKKYDTLSKAGTAIKNKYEKGFIDFCVELVEVLFFIYSSDPRMPTSINVVELLDEIQSFVRGKYIFSNNHKSVKFPAIYIARIDEKITDETHQILRHKEVIGGAGLMETLNLLELQSLMFPRNRVSQEVLMKFLQGVDTTDPEVFNFLTIFQLIHFAERKRNYNKVLDFALEKTKPLIRKCRETGGADTEGLLTVIELLADPFIDRSALAALDEGVSGSEWDGVKSFFEKRRELFVSWSDHPLSEDIRFLKNAEVY